MKKESALWGWWSRIVNGLSGEWILTLTRRANGGDLILLRTIYITAVVYGLVLGGRELLDPRTVFIFDSAELKKLINTTGLTLGTIFGAVYASLYTRFTSQWRYLADLYNKIKENEVKGAGDPLAMAAWKAGFIEDASELHLATKPLFVSVIRVWANDAAVRAAFIDHTPGRGARLDALIAEVDAAFHRVDQRHQVSASAAPSAGVMELKPALPRPTPGSRPGP